jgi:hypothetical protein
MGGLVPYVVTSFSTIYLAWDINYAAVHDGAGYLVSRETADHLLHILEPIQIGLGAIILSYVTPSSTCSFISFIEIPRD